MYKEKNNATISKKEDLGSDLPIYHIERRISETDLDFSDVLNAGAIAKAINVDVATVQKWLAEAKNK